MDNMQQFMQNTTNKNLEYMAKYGNACGEANISSENLNPSLIIPYGITDPLLEACHLVESFRSDLLISLESLKSIIIDRTIDKKEPKYAVIAFRKSGVDGNQYFLNHLQGWHATKEFSMREYYYRRIFIVKIKELNDGDISLTLVDGTGSIPYSDAEKETSWQRQ